MPSDWILEAQERLQFEEWARSEDLPLDRELDAYIYSDTRTDKAFGAWLERGRRDSVRLSLEQVEVYMALEKVMHRALQLGKDSVGTSSICDRMAGQRLTEHGDAASAC